jgi:putative tryptophan/tyrosine transport system substrate-binding protein
LTSAWNGPRNPSQLLVNHTYSEYYLTPFEAAATANGVATLALQVRSAADIAQAFATRERDDGIVAMSDPFLAVNGAVINEMTIKYRLPVVSGISQSGSLIAYAPDTVDLFRRSAAYVDRILRGALPADLPVQLPTKFELEINAKMARAIGIEISSMLLAQADEVFE